MLKQPRQILLILLALIQFVAPLVHAHTNTTSASFGLHVPGLETYSTDDLAQFLSASSQLDHSEGLMVGVDVGMRQNLADSQSDEQPMVVLPSKLVIKSPQLLAFDVNFSPQLPGFLPQLLFSLQSPRAPPFQAII